MQVDEKGTGDNHKSFTSKGLFKESVIGVVGGLLGFIVSQSLGFYAFHENLVTTKKIEMIKLSRELTSDFYSEDLIYKRIRVSIDKCEKLYKNNGGKYTFDEINTYLNFFDNMAYFYRQNVLEERAIDQIFGAYIIEAYENNELRIYIANFQKNTGQTKAFAEFQALAKKLEEYPENKDHVEQARLTCSVKS